MTTPHMPAPDGAYVIDNGDWGQGLSEAEVIARMTGGASGNLHDANDRWANMVSDVTDQIGVIEDAQLEMQGSVEMLEGVRGYCSLYLDKNWTVPGNATKNLPFNAQLGPNQGAEPANGLGIKLLEKGLWRADAHVSFQVQSGWFNGPARADLYLTVRKISDWSTYHQRQYSIVVGNAGDETAHFSSTFVIPEDDTYIVCVDLHHQNSNQKVFGGTRRSALSVNKWDFRIDNAVILDTVPDGGAL